MLSADKNKVLTQVGPGTPMGDYLRRYWQPIAGASELDANPIRAIRLLGRCPMLQRIPARLVGLGFRPEHIRTPEVEAAASEHG